MRLFLRKSSTVGTSWQGIRESKTGMQIPALKKGNVILQSAVWGGKKEGRLVVGGTRKNSPSSPPKTARGNREKDHIQKLQKLKKGCEATGTSRSKECLSLTKEGLGIRIFFKLPGEVTGLGGGGSIPKI